MRLFAFLVIFTCTSAICQESNRVSLGLLWAKNDSKFQSEVGKSFYKLKVSDKFNAHNTNKREIFVSPSIQAVDKTIKKEKIANELLAKWFNRKENGEFDTKLLEERGLYSASDAEMLQANASQRGLANLDAKALNLVDLTYLMVFSVDSLEDYKIIYDKQDARRKKNAEVLGISFVPVVRKKNGYSGNARVFVYKLNFNDSTSQVFFENYWINENDSNKQAKKNAFEQNDFALNLVTAMDFQAEASQNNPEYNILPLPQLSREELMDNMMMGLQNTALFKLERLNKNFQTSAYIYKSSPITAKIGKKEDLKIDNRYFVYEKIANEKGDTKEVRAGVVRAGTDIEDNRQISEGNSQGSKFYQISGRKIREGFVMRQKSDIGMGIMVGYEQNFSAPSNKGVIFGIDQNLAKIGLPFKSFKIFAQGKVTGSETYNISYNKQNLDHKLSSFMVSAGFHKEWHFAHALFAGVSLAYFHDFATSDVNQADFFSTSNAKKLEIQVGGIKPAVNFGVFMAYPWSLFVRASYELPIFVLHSGNETIPASTFEKRYQLQASAGLRIEF